MARCLDSTGHTRGRHQWNCRPERVALESLIHIGFDHIQVQDGIPGSGGIRGGQGDGEQARDGRCSRDFSGHGVEGQPGRKIGCAEAGGIARSGDLVTERQAPLRRHGGGAGDIGHHGGDREYLLHRGGGLVTRVPGLAGRDPSRAGTSDGDRAAVNDRHVGVGAIIADGKIGRGIALGQRVGGECDWRVRLQSLVECAEHDRLLYSRVLGRGGGAVDFRLGDVDVTVAGRIAPTNQSYIPARGVAEVHCLVTVGQAVGC